MHRRTIIDVATAAVLLCVAFPASRVVALSSHVSPRVTGQPPHETGCGVERWSVKVGMDPDARLVNRRTAVPTNIVQLRALPAPASPPLNSRVRPVETTVWSLDAILLRYKQEDDSDYHLVLADTGGRTMIAEIPSPACAGPSSPFLPAMRVVRTAFTAAFHPTISFQRVNVTVHVTGVGFFDFKHGQSGVAPNAIELHPILSIRWGTGGTAPPADVSTPAPVTEIPIPTTRTPAPASGSGSTGTLAVRVQVTPDPTVYRTDTTVRASTVPGAHCGVRVVYASGTASTSRALQVTQVADARGMVAWTWRYGSRITGHAHATVTCTLGDRQGTGTATFAAG